MARVLRPGGRLVLGELGRWSLWAMIRRLRGWFGSATWTAARFRTASELRALVEQAGLSVTTICGAVFYPPIGRLARTLAPFDPWLGRLTTIGAAFIALCAVPISNHVRMVKPTYAKAGGRVAHWLKIKNPGGARHDTRGRRGLRLTRGGVNPTAVRQIKYR